MTAASHLAHFNLETVFEAGVLPGDLGSFIQAPHHQLYEASDRFLRFRVRAIDHALSTRAGDDTRLELERLALHRFAFSGQTIIPSLQRPGGGRPVRSDWNGPESSLDSVHRLGQQMVLKT